MKTPWKKRDYDLRLLLYNLTKNIYKEKIKIVIRTPFCQSGAD